MDVAMRLASGEQNKTITCIDMHTTGEPARIVIKGYPELSGSLLQQRTEAKEKYDRIRRTLMLEPRGHYDMYGAILRPDTEHTQSGEAHIGVLFLTNNGYSDMCGHATIALGRLLLDTHDEDVFPRRRQVKHDSITQTATIMLHAPCGLLEVTVPVNADGSASDPNRPVSFVSVPSFATGIEVDVPIPSSLRWPELGETRHAVQADFAYGGAFFCLIKARELGFVNGLNSGRLDELSRATAGLKKAVRDNPDLAAYFRHPDHDDLDSLYSIIVIDDTSLTSDSEVGLCFYADWQVDRSPTGSGVAARVALAYAKGQRKLNEPWRYHSLVSKAGLGPAFTGTLVEVLGGHEDIIGPQIMVKVEGQAFYTGCSTFSVEENDPLGDDGFVFGNLSQRG
jgi:trans-L-3-hydroxyproline dehydratase